METIIDTTNTAPNNSTPEANGGQGEKMFTQDDVNRIVSERLAREREKYTQQPREDERETALKERENGLKARESRLACRDYLDEKKLPRDLLELIGTDDEKKFQETVEKLVALAPALEGNIPGRGKVIIPGVDIRGGNVDRIAEAFKPKI